MGFNTGNKRSRLVSDINVTPLVDVMLVLLIIFMVTAPMMTQGLEVDLPETTAKSLRQKEEPVIVTLDKDGKILLGKIEVSQTMFRQQLEKQHGKNTEQPIFLKADKNVAYGVVVALMADIKSAGFDKLGMITDPIEEPR
ncbi:Cell division and transport-associated protein TolR [Desulfocapsa sulfexigens DSM 10523]|uniref:Cell division and transport-associated protein TolR n=1 Tax=Desulfocapsa sulfexigens (strain DSM 10523 / SB164P1) TaxID=1167006 RepID=M1NJ00_DESSD|nr:protein TolR [Desulfocapsa sulfexigens]AGF79509.1 Cell division and transport-associated protein TolR [Desulfocapsa sulfexigens DSM 10523]